MRYADFPLGRHRSCSEIEFQCGAVQRSLKAFHGKGLLRVVHVVESDGCKVDCFLLVGKHFIFTVERDEIPVRGIGIGFGAVKRPGHLVCTGLPDPGSLFFREREGQ